MNFAAQASWANFWFYSRKSWNFCLDGSMWSCSHLQHVKMMSSRLARFVLVMFRYVYRASPLRREWKECICSSSEMFGYILRLVVNRSSTCSNLLLRPSNVGIVVDNAFGSLGNPRFCWVTFLSDPNSLFTMSSGYFWFGGGKLDDLVGISWGTVTPVTMCWSSPLINSFTSIGLEVGIRLSG